jgi:hypothetical protein
MYELYRAKFEITQWKNGAVFRTKWLKTGWFDAKIVDENKPRETNIMYVAASDEFANNNMTMRKKKGS